MEFYRPPTAEELSKRWESDPRWKGIRRDYTPKDVVQAARLGAHRIDAGAAGPETLWQLLHTEPYVPALGAVTGNQAIQMVEAGLKAIYLSGWQVAADANLAGQMYPDQSLYPCNSAPALVRAINNAFRRADQIQHAEGRGRSRLLRPDRRRRRGRLRRPAQRVRDHEGHDRGRRRGRPLRGPARQREEVRPHGGQGARPHLAVPPRPQRRPARRRRHGRPHRPGRPHRRPVGPPGHQRRRRARPAVPDRRADPRGLLRADRRPPRRHQPRPLLRPLRRPALVRDLRAQPRRGQEVRRVDPREVPGQAAGLQLLALVQLEGQARRRRRSPGSSASWAAMGYKFQFITLAGFHVLNLSMFDLARAYKRRRHGRLLAGSSRPSSPARPRAAITPSSTSGSSAPATSTRSPSASPPASRPPRP